MELKRLGNSDMTITAIGFGAWAIGGPNWEWGWGQQDDAESVAAILRALERGVNWIDTAAVYGLGRSEEVVRTALAQWRGSRPYVFTKCGMVWGRRRTVGLSLRKKSIRRECEASLRRLGVETIDLYQIHWPSPERDLEEGWSAVGELVREGKVRYAGLSNCNVAQMKRAQAIWPITSLQPPYSMINRDVETEILPYCAEQRIGVIAYSPLQAGLLTGRFSKERVAGLDAEDWRRHDRFFQEPALSRTLQLCPRLRQVAERDGRTTAQLAIAWVLRRPEITAAIVGARRPEQIEETAVAGDYRPGPEVLAEVERLLAEGRGAG